MLSEKVGTVALSVLLCLEWVVGGFGSFLSFFKPSGQNSLLCVFMRDSDVQCALWLINLSCCA